MSDLTNFVAFNSNAVKPYNKLSNFNRAPFTFTEDDIDVNLLRINPNLSTFSSALDSVVFQSTEHAWQALTKALDRATFERFVSGDLSRFDEAAFEPYNRPPKKPRKQSDAPKKSIVKTAASSLRVWAAKDNVGIVPKMAANPKNGKLVGLDSSKMNYDNEHLDARSEHDIWIKLLLLKFRQNKVHRDVLLATGDAYLLEFDRGAERAEAISGTKVHWGGMIKDGRLFGDNAMGKYMMEVRTLLKNETL